MKILLHSDKMDAIEKSGVGRAIKHQMKALELNNVEYTLDPNDDYDIIVKYIKKGDRNEK